MTQPQQHHTNAGDHNINNNTATSHTFNQHGYGYGVYAAANASPSVTAKSTLPAFLNKLYGMVAAPETDPWVHWNEEGTSFIIPNHQELAEHVLGRHFKHNNFASFVRQLNMYGFHKVPHLNHGVLHNDGLPEVWEFVNEHFQRDHPEYMKYIVRKKGEAEKARSAAKHRSASPASPVSHHFNDAVDVAIVRAELHNVASRQNMIRDEVFRIKSRQDDLWKFALETRQRHDDQRDKINMIIKFLSEAFSRKRAAPAMAGSEAPNKVRGLIEPAIQPPVVEELSEKDTPSIQAPSSPVPEQTVVDIMKMLANGKVPVEFHEAVQQYLMNLNANQQVNNYATTPFTPTSPATFDSPDALIQTNAMQNAQHMNQIQSWLNSEDQTISGLTPGLGIDFNSNDPNHPLTNINMGNNVFMGSNEDYTSYLHDTPFQVDPFTSNPDPALDIFSTDTLHPAWQPYLDNTTMTQDINAFTTGPKRSYDEQEETMGEYSSGKKARV